MKTLRIFGALLRKELTLMKRSPIIPKIIVGMPIIVLLVIPLVATFDVKNVKVTAIDNDHSQLSRRIISDIDATDALDIMNVCASYSEGLKEIETGNADVILTIPPNYERNMSKLEVEANGVNATKSMLGMQYVVGSINSTLAQWRTDNGILGSESPGISIINRYNPTLNFKNYMIPALLVFLLILICGFLPVLNLVSEKESGTIEAMNVTPVGKFTFVLSKLLPYWVIAILVVTIGILIGWAVYGLFPVGNLGSIYLAVILLSFFMSGFGVTIANKSATMLQSIFVMFAFIMIFQLMGGLFTPIGSMPEWAQYVTYAIPPRFFNEIMRAVYLKGTLISEITSEYLWLGAYALLACLLAALTYKKRS